MGVSRQEYWSKLPFPFPGDLLDQGIEIASQALAEGFFTAEPPGKSMANLTVLNNSHIGLPERILRFKVGI